MLARVFSTCCDTHAPWLNRLQFIRDNVTTTEVSIARVYNEDIRRRRAKKEAGGAQ